MIHEKIKDLVMFGLGSAMLTGEMIQEMAEEFRKAGEKHRENCESIGDEIREKSKRHREDMEKKFKNLVKELGQDVGLVFQEDVDELKAELTKLSERITKLENSEASS